MATLRTIRLLRVLALSTIATSLMWAGSITTTDGLVTVTNIVTPVGGGLFQYNYTITDGTGLLIDLDIAVSTGIPITGFAAPGGVNTANSAFTAVTDTVNTGQKLQEYVSFIVNQGAFSGTPQSGFIFLSPVAPMSTTFGITLADGIVGSANGLTGPVTPEPASLPLFAFGAAAFLVLRKRIVSSRSL